MRPLMVFSSAGSFLAAASFLTSAPLDSTFGASFLTSWPSAGGSGGVQDKMPASVIVNKPIAARAWWRVMSFPLADPAFGIPDANLAALALGEAAAADQPIAVRAESDALDPFLVVAEGGALS